MGWAMKDGLSNERWVEQWKMDSIAVIKKSFIQNRLWVSNETWVEQWKMGCVMRNGFHNWYKKKSPFRTDYGWAMKNGLNNSKWVEQWKMGWAIERGHFTRVGVILFVSVLPTSIQKHFYSNWSINIGWENCIFQDFL